jgi:hypothetical protein
VKSKHYYLTDVCCSLITSKLYAEKHSDVTILYADVVNFTQITTQLPVRLLVETLHELFVKFDEASVVRRIVFNIKFVFNLFKFLGA